MSSVFSICLLLSVSSVCLAYDERMSNVLFIRLHTLKIFEHVQNIILASAYNNVHRRLPAYEELTRRMPSVSLTYICLYERIIIRWHTLMSYAVVWLHFKRHFVFIFLKQVRSQREWKFTSNQKQYSFNYPFKMCEYNNIIL